MRELVRHFPSATMAPLLTLGFLLSENPDRFIRFTCRNEACRNRLPVDKPLGEMTVALGEQRTLKSIKGRCNWCGRSDQVEVTVWKMTWSGAK